MEENLSNSADGDMKKKKKTITKNTRDKGKQRQKKQLQHSSSTFNMNKKDKSLHIENPITYGWDTYRKIKNQETENETKLAAMEFATMDTTLKSPEEVKTNKETKVEDIPENNNKSLLTTSPIIEVKSSGEVSENNETITHRLPTTNSPIIEVPTLDQSALEVKCQKCKTLTEGMENLQKQFQENFKIIKKKMFSTSELIKEFHQKGKELEASQAALKEVKAKLDKVYSESGVMRIQLEKALQANEPFKRAIQRMENEKKLAETAVTEIQMKLKRSEDHVVKLKSALTSTRIDNTDTEKEKKENVKLYEKEQSKVLKQGRLIDKLNTKLKDSKALLRTERKNLKIKTKENEKLKLTTERLKDDKAIHHGKLEYGRDNGKFGQGRGKPGKPIKREGNGGRGRAAKYSPDGVLSPSPSPPPTPIQKSFPPIRHNKAGVKKGGFKKTKTKTVSKNNLKKTNAMEKLKRAGMLKNFIQGGVMNNVEISEEDENFEEEENKRDVVDSFRVGDEITPDLSQESSSSSSSSESDDDKDEDGNDDGKYDELRAELSKIMGPQAKSNLLNFSRFTMLSPPLSPIPPSPLSWKSTKKSTNQTISIPRKTAAVKLDSSLFGDLSDDSDDDDFGDNGGGCHDDDDDDDVEDNGNDDVIVRDVLEMMLVRVCNPTSENVSQRSQEKRKRNKAFGVFPTVPSTSTAQQNPKLSTGDNRGGSSNSAHRKPSINEIFMMTTNVPCSNGLDISSAGSQVNGNHDQHQTAPSVEQIEPSCSSQDTFDEVNPELYSINHETPRFSSSKIETSPEYLTQESKDEEETSGFPEPESLLNAISRSEVYEAPLTQKRLSHSKTNFHDLRGGRARIAESKSCSGVQNARSTTTKDSRKISTENTKEKLQKFKFIKNSKENENVTASSTKLSDHKQSPSAVLHQPSSTLTSNQNQGSFKQITQDPNLPQASSMINIEKEQPSKQIEQAHTPTSQGVSVSTSSKILRKDKSASRNRTDGITKGSSISSATKTAKDMSVASQFSRVLSTDETDSEVASLELNLNDRASSIPNSLSTPPQQLTAESRVHPVAMPITTSSTATTTSPASRTLENLLRMFSTTPNPVLSPITNANIAQPRRALARRHSMFSRESVVPKARMERRRTYSPTISISPPLSPIPPSPRRHVLTPLISPLPTTPLPDSISPLPPSPKITSPPLIRGSALVQSENSSVRIPVPVVHKRTSAVQAINFNRQNNSLRPIRPIDQAAYSKRPEGETPQGGPSKKPALKRTRSAFSLQQATTAFDKKEIHTSEDDDDDDKDKPEKVSRNDKNNDADAKLEGSKLQRKKQKLSVQRPFTRSASREEMSQKVSDDKNDNKPGKIIRKEKRSVNEDKLPHKKPPFDHHVSHDDVSKPNANEDFQNRRERETIKTTSALKAESEKFKQPINPPGEHPSKSNVKDPTVSTSTDVSDHLEVENEFKETSRTTGEKTDNKEKFKQPVRKMPQPAKRVPMTKQDGHLSTSTDDEGRLCIASDHFENEDKTEKNLERSKGNDNKIEEFNKRNEKDSLTTYRPSALNENDALNTSTDDDGRLRIALESSDDDRLTRNLPTLCQLVSSCKKAPNSEVPSKRRKMEDSDSKSQKMDEVSTSEIADSLKPISKVRTINTSDNLPTKEKKKKQLTTSEKKKLERKQMLGTYCRGKGEPEKRYVARILDKHFISKTLKKREIVELFGKSRNILSATSIGHAIRNTALTCTEIVLFQVLNEHDKNEIPTRKSKNSLDATLNANRFYICHPPMKDVATPLMTDAEHTMMWIVKKLQHCSWMKKWEFDLLETIRASMFLNTPLLTCELQSLCRMYACVCRIFDSLHLLILFLYTIAFDKLPNVSFAAVYLTCYTVWPSIALRNDLLALQSPNEKWFKVKLSPLSATFQILALYDSVHDNQTLYLKLMEKLFVGQWNKSLDISVLLKELGEEIYSLLKNEELSYLEGNEVSGYQLNTYSFSCLQSLMLLCRKCGWEYTYNNFIVQKIWSDLSEFVQRKSDLKRAALLIILTGHLCQCGTASGFCAFQELAEFIAGFLNSSTPAAKDEGWRIIELAAASTLIQILPHVPDHCKQALRCWTERAAQEQRCIPAPLQEQLSNLIQ